MNREWLAVFESLNNVYTKGAYSNIAINEALLHHKGCKESFVRNYVKGVLRDTIRIDYYIDILAAKGIAGIDKRPLIIIRMGIYAIEKLGSVPDHAAVNESVNLAKKVARGSGNFVNGILRSYLRKKDEIIIPNDREDIQYSISPEILSLIKNQYGEDAINIIAGLKSAPDTNLRVNRLVSGRDEVIAKLKESGIDAKPSEYSPNAISAEGSAIVGSELYKDGYISIQSLSSMMAVEALNLKPGSRVLDMCAAPGGKSAYMAELMDNFGEIVACDIYEHKLKLIERTVDRLHIKAVRTECRDGSIHFEDFDETFDYVLADVPCSGLGVMGSKPELCFTSNPGTYTDIIRTQKLILDNAILYAKQGGMIEYSTCTINKDENEKVIEAALESHGHSLLSIIEMKTLLPYNNKVGFFYCVLKKNSG